MTENVPERETCDSCGEKFGCGAKLDGCWCTELTLSPEAADELKTKFNDCLCPKCLGSYKSGGTRRPPFCDKRNQDLEC